MMDQLKKGPRVVGAKQTRRALAEGRAVRVFLAADADPRITAPIVDECRRLGVPTEEPGDMKTLGQACGIAVGAAVAALLSGF